MDAKLAAAFDRLLTTFREYRVNGRPETGFNEPDINEIRLAFQAVKTEMARVYLAPEGVDGGSLPPIATLNAVIALETELNAVAASAADLPALATALGSWLNQSVAQSIIDAETYAPTFAAAFQLSDAAAINTRIDDVLRRRLGPRLAFEAGFPGWTTSLSSPPGGGAPVAAPWGFVDDPVYGPVARIQDPTNVGVALATSDLIYVQAGDIVRVSTRWVWTGGGTNERIGNIYLVPVDPADGRALGQVVANEFLREGPEQLNPITMEYVADGAFQALRIWIRTNSSFAGTGDLMIQQFQFERDTIQAPLAIVAAVETPDLGSGWVWSNVPSASNPFVAPTNGTATLDINEYGSDPDTDSSDLVYSLVTADSALTITGPEGSVFTVAATSAGSFQATFRVSDGVNVVDQVFIFEARAVFPVPSFQPVPRRIYNLGQTVGPIDWKDRVLPSSIKDADMTFSISGGVPGITFTAAGIESGTVLSAGYFETEVTVTLPDGQSATVVAETYINPPPAPDPNIQIPNDPGPDGEWGLL